MNLPPQQKDNWILKSVREPQEKDLPILIWNDRVPKAKWIANKDALVQALQLPRLFTFWMPAPFSVPVVPELTQEQKDLMEFDIVVPKNLNLLDYRWAQSLWLTACNYSRHNERIKFNKGVEQFIKDYPILSKACNSLRSITKEKDNI